MLLMVRPLQNFKLSSISTLMKYETKDVPKIIQQSFENDEGYRENNGYAKDTLVRDDSAFTTINLIGQGLREDTALIHQ